MKTLFLLLVCLAAANAAVFTPTHCGGYIRYNFKQFSYINYGCFRYRIQCSSSWWTTKYYSDILKKYPGEQCTEDGFTESSVGDYEAGITSALQGAATKIYGELDQAREKWENELKKQVQDSKDDHQAKVNKYMNDLKKQYEQNQDALAEIETAGKKSIKDYADAVDELEKKAIKDYGDAMQRKYKCVLDYHKKLVENSVKCFNTRLTKIAEYKKILKDRVVKYENRYKCFMDSIVAKRADMFRKVLYKIHCSETWQAQQVDAVIKEFTKKETDWYNKQLQEYSDKLKAARIELEKLYTCAYQCAAGGTLCFAKSQYYSSCKNVQWTYKFNTRNYCSRFVKYSFNYTPRKYKELTKCDVDKVNQSEEAFKADLSKKVADVVTAMNKKYDAWYKEAKGTNVKCLEEFKKIVTDRHACLLKHFQAKILVRENCISGKDVVSLEDYKQELKDQETKVVKEYEEKLKERLEKASKCYKSMITCHKDSLEKRNKKYVEAYGTCLSTRLTKIDDYEKRLRKVFEERKKCLTDRMDRVYKCMTEQYEKMMKSYMCVEVLNGAGKVLYEEYQKKIKKDHDDVVKKINDEWEKRIGELKQHYACGYKCRYCVTVPELKITYTYRCPSITSSCYTYGYKIYRCYSNYQLISCGGVFQYVKKE